MKSHLTAKSFVVFRRVRQNGGQILVQEGYDRIVKKAFFRPPGGKVEFGEYSEQAAVREIREELGAEITNITGLGMLENIFELEGVQGHEIIFVFEARFADQNLYDQDALIAVEGRRRFEMTWIDLADFMSEKVRLVPPELLTLLQDADTIPLMQ